MDWWPATQGLVLDTRAAVFVVHCVQVLIIALCLSLLAIVPRYGAFTMRFVVFAGLGNFVRRLVEGSSVAWTCVLVGAVLLVCWGGFLWMRAQRGPID